MQLPFEIPPSLANYAEQFEMDASKATTKLEKHLEKRGPDAVGHFLLAWFYYLQDEQEKAVDHALTAKTYAPGSPFFEKLHYYFAHPSHFNAWTPVTEKYEGISSTTDPAQPDPMLDLDALIDRLSNVETTQIRAKKMDSKEDAVDLSEDSVETDDIASETIAKIHEKQGKIEAAIQTYKRLINVNGDKKEHYQKEITRLEKQHKEELDN